jgi:hypothetical protein
MRHQLFLMLGKPLIMMRHTAACLASYHMLAAGRALERSRMIWVYRIQIRVQQQGGSELSSACLTV